MLLLLGRVVASSPTVKFRIPSIKFFSKSSFFLTRPFINTSGQNSYPSTWSDSNYLGGRYSLPSLSQYQSQLDSNEIEVVDLDTWSVSSGLAYISKNKQKQPESSMLSTEEIDDGIISNVKEVEYDADFDDIEDMRVHGNLFYKIEKSSIEFEEYKFDFHGRKPKYNPNDKVEGKKREKPKGDVALKDRKMDLSETKMKPDLKDGFLLNKERLVKSIKDKYVICDPHDLDTSSTTKKPRIPTFNQLTGPLHEPFCLDIHVSKGSVRACVVHRVTSKVVAVAHSISKDMKFGIGSTKSRVAASSVGKVLAQRALADDIHNVIYTPRKGDKLEGKLHLVLQSIIDNGVNVKVRVKQRNSKKTC